MGIEVDHVDQPAIGSLSVLMIAKNEAHQIHHAISSVRDVAIQIVVVDTGSSDDTSKVAAELGAEVFFYDWDQNFSNARNHGLRRCAGEWVLSLDCDEIVSMGTPQVTLLARALRDTEKVAYTLPLVSKMPNGLSRTHRSVRLFRNSEKIEFRNPVHESVAGAIAEHFREDAVGDLAVPIEHLGYSREENRSKVLRNLEILGAWLQQEPDNPYATYKFAAAVNVFDESASEPIYARALELIKRGGHEQTYPFFGDLEAAVARFKAGSNDARLA